MIEFTKEQLRALLEPCVYVFYEGEACLYVGSSRCASRPFDKAHHQYRPFVRPHGWSFTVADL